jgi:hypothetical protein
MERVRLGFQSDNENGKFVNVNNTQPTGRTNFYEFAIDYSKFVKFVI